MLREIAMLLRRDLRIEFRSREIIFSMMLFALIEALIFSFAFNINVERSRAFGPGILWLTILFAATMGLGQSFGHEREDGCFRALLMSPVRRMSVFFSKLMANLIYTFLMECLAIPLLVLFLSLDVPQPLVFLLTIVSGTLGICIGGTLFAALLARSRHRDILLPMLLYPIIVPVLIPCVMATKNILLDYPFEQIWSYVGVVITFDLVIGFVGTLLFEKLIQED